MIDDHGRVRITDFGLAGLEAELKPDGGGTPAYMAPEQLSGGAASIQSDLYSLGLVLYEVFTGKRAYETRAAKRPADSTPRPPSTLTPDIDPAVERVVMRCLEPDPKLRPTSAYAVLGALPGGDPLAAALAAGETPSPELVASATVEGSLRPAVAIACVLLTVASLVGLAAVDRKQFTGFHQSDTELAVRSSQLLAEAGIAKHAYSYSGFMENSIFMTRVEQRDSSALALHAAHPDRATGILYWRRWSPVALKHPDMHNPSPNLFEPVPGPGGVMELLDMDGRLVHLSSMPTASGEPAGPKPTRRATNWPDFVSAAGYDATRTVTANTVTATTTTATTTMANATTANTTAATTTLDGADSVTTSTVPGQAPGDAPVTLQATWRNGGVDRFWIDAPWGTSRDPFALAAPSEDRWFTLIFFTLIPLLGSVLFAIRNLRAGRGDRRGAWRLALFTFLAYLTAHALFLNWSEMGLANAMEFMLRQAPMGHALLHGMTVWLLYMALEPYIRRLWPRVLVSWARLMSGRPRDPMIGRDILVGFMFVAFNTVGTLATMPLRRLPGAERTFFGMLDTLSGTGPTLAGMANFAAGGTQIVMAFFTILLIARILLRKNWAAIAFACVFFGTIYFLQGARSNGPLATAIGTAMGLTAFAFVALRFGFLAALISAFLSQVADQIPWTTDLSAWYAGRMLIAVAVFGVLMAYGFFTALGGRSIFRDPIGETG
ncbi:MAG TPA: protein kinase, partial [Candidatus Eisenbacteria bacterium]|nr:protein kinase [Candidatus Eisenbacteria bacterium]